MNHLVVQYSQRFVGGEILQFGLEDDGVSSPARLDHLLPVLVVEAALVLDEAEHTQILAHVPRHRALAELQTLYGRAGGTHRAEVSGHKKSRTLHRNETTNRSLTFILVQHMDQF